MTPYKSFALSRNPAGCDGALPTGSVAQLWFETPWSHVPLPWERRGGSHLASRHPARRSIAWCRAWYARGTKYTGVKNTLNILLCIPFFSLLAPLFSLLSSPRSLFCFLFSLLSPLFYLLHIVSLLSDQTSIEFPSRLRSCPQGLRGRFNGGWPGFRTCCSKGHKSAHCVPHGAASADTSGKV